MAHLIDKDAVLAEIKNLIERAEAERVLYPKTIRAAKNYLLIEDYKKLLSFLDTLEVKEVDMEKLGEIARHLIAVKEHIEDMRLDKEEWFMLEKIGYPENFKAQKSNG